MKVAIVCDFLTKFGGAQQVLLAIHEVYPEAPIYCLMYDEKGTKGRFKDCQIIESSLGKLPSFLKTKTKFFLPTLPKRIEEFDFADYDLVISSNDSYAHGVITKPTTFHVCYCHTPMRYVWDWHFEYLKENNLDHGLKGMIVKNILHKIRLWDRISAHRVDKWLANSENVKKRIAKYYRADAEVLYPPVNVKDIHLSTAKSEDFYVIVSRLEPYKRVALAVEACNKLKKRLVVIGEGSEMAHLKKIAGETISLLGWQSEKSMYEYLQKAKAFIFPADEDFGITPVEAMAAGKPVIALKKGGALETVIDQTTGVFFEEATTDSLVLAIENFEKNVEKFSPKVCRDQAEKFSKEAFEKNLKTIIERDYKNYLESYK